jgi:tripartite-type tricarboxylate transporter receptor subunit TctC
MPCRLPRRWLPALLLAPRPGRAASWPARPIRMISPLPAGTLSDITMRLYAEGLARRLGQPVVVENRPGGDAVVATMAFLNLQDDHRLFFSFAGPVTVNPLTMPRLPYDPAALQPLSLAALDHMAVAGAPDLPVQDLAGLVALARARPGQITCMVAPGAIGLAFEGFLAAQGLDLLRVAYRSPADAWTDVAAGRVQVTVTPLASALPHAAAGRARLLALTSPERVAAAPELATTVEQGFPDYVFQGFVGVFGPPGMPASHQAVVSEAMGTIAAEPEIIRRLALGGQVALGSTPAECAARIAAQRAQVAAGLAALGRAAR